MRKYSSIAAAALLALGAGQAVAADYGWDGTMFSGDATVRHSYISPDDGGDSGHGVGFGGTAILNFGTNFHFQLSGNYDHGFTGDEDLDVLQGQGMMFWRDPTVGLIGVSADAGALYWGNFADLNVYRGGVYGQYYGADILTLSGGLGIVDSDGKSKSTFPQTEGMGYYLQAGITYYLSDHFAVGTAAYLHDISDVKSNQSGVAVAGEYLLPLGLPTSVNVGYAYSDSGDGFDTHLLRAGLKLNFGSDGSSIMSLHRTGAGDSGDYSSFILGY
jgi:hypothetical protein